MRVLLDENLPRQLKRRLAPAVEAQTVQERGWSGKENSELLQLAEVEFDALLTMDRGVEFQQDIRDMSLSVLVIRAPSNRFADLEPLLPEVGETLKAIQPGQVIRVGA
ncbi:DUF5615 family PIN-like protein [Candidatus Bipolaricaulota bacterium]|nr:DUF5615 family PIN-like protein [Candidatus Bipolaricaulota bacterium]